MSAKRKSHVSVGKNLKEKAVVGAIKIYIIDKEA